MNGSVDSQIKSGVVACSKKYNGGLQKDSFSLSCKEIWRKKCCKVEYVQEDDNRRKDKRFKTNGDKEEKWIQKCAAKGT